ncbi:hypothetical protein [Kineosporia sp. NBRC 101731]|uniref:hypothetical protein n=1 Tax=Kineosporia sp. NBRC 101731 TaxID=3032199 RepID=UPI0024A5555B|nr:hypothetical protein [Kineosporia sp. NBRC 101731]GLY32438.1 hypothetical protein Kisp02_58030 [Kineosporia sp. NBRC 101731]
MYALYAWGNFIQEVDLDREPGWVTPALLRGEHDVVSDHLLIVDDGSGPLLVDGPNTIFEVDDELVLGSQLVDRDLSQTSWRVAYIRVATDGTLQDALRITGKIEDVDDYYADRSPQRNPVVLGQEAVGEVVTTWEDNNGQWDLALIRLRNDSPGHSS